MIARLRDTLSPVYLPDPINRAHPLNHRLLNKFLVVPGLDGGSRWYDLVTGYGGALTSMDSSSGWRSSLIAGCSGELLFDGTNDTVLVPDGVIRPGLGNISVMLRYRHITQVAGFPSLMAIRGSGNSNFHVDFESGIAWVLSGVVVAGSGVAMTAGHIYTVIIAYTRVTSVTFHIFDETARTYATATASVANTPVAGSTSVSGIGSSISGGAGQASTWYAGGIADVSIWDRLLSQSEAFWLFNEAREGYPSVLNRIDVFRGMDTAGGSRLFRRSLSERVGSRGRMTGIGL